MSPSWTPLISTILQSQSRRQIRYVAAGSWYEITHGPQKLAKDEECYSATAPFKTKAVLRNLGPQIYARGTFLLPAEVPVGGALGYYAVLCDERAWVYRVVRRGSEVEKCEWRVVAAAGARGGDLNTAPSRVSGVQPPARGQIEAKDQIQGVEKSPFCTDDNGCLGLEERQEESAGSGGSGSTQESSVGSKPDSVMAFPEVDGIFSTFEAKNEGFSQQPFWLDLSISEVAQAWLDLGFFSAQEKETWDEIEDRVFFRETIDESTEEGIGESFEENVTSSHEVDLNTVFGMGATGLENVENVAKVQKASFHHKNFDHRRVHLKSTTPPEVSLWLICISNKDNRRHHYHQMRQAVICSQAGIYIDPIHYHGPMEHLELSGSTMLRSIRGHVVKVYQPVGRWCSESYGRDEVVPKSYADVPNVLNRVTCTSFHRPQPRKCIDSVNCTYYREKIVNDDGRAHIRPMRRALIPSKLRFQCGVDGNRTEASADVPASLFVSWPVKRMRKSNAIENDTEASEVSVGTPRSANNTPIQAPPNRTLREENSVEKEQDATREENSAPQENVEVAEEVALGKGPATISPLVKNAVERQTLDGSPASTTTSSVPQLSLLAHMLPDFD